MAEERDRGLPLIKLAIIVEGPTEVAFVKEVLLNHLWRFGVNPVVPIPINPRERAGAGGGNVSVSRLVDHMVFTRKKNYEAVTSLVDFYGFRDKGERSVEALQEHIAREIQKKIPDSRRMFPYVQRHEFEGLLFSDTNAFREVALASEQDIEALSNIRLQFKTPEDINDDPEGAPSKRIMRTLRGYGKVQHGPSVARKAGLEKIREECPRFHAWLKCLEGLNANIALN